MGFASYVSETRPRLEAAITECLGAVFADMALPEPGDLVALLEQGKKIRGCLVCLASDALGGSADSPLPRAVAVELVHAATLIHDDFVDQDVMRRNRPAVWTFQGARRAVLLGDVIFATAVRMMSDLGREDGRVLSDAISRVSMGAFREPLDPQEMARAVGGSDSDEAVYETIIRLKTGVLFGAACELGAVAAGASGEARARLRAYGLRLGEAYQIADDAGDVARHLAVPTLEPGRMVSLAPALLFFAGERGPDLALAFSGAGGADDPLRDALGLAAARMNEEIERRIEAALVEIRGLGLGPQGRDLMCGAPRDLISMFRRAH